MDPNANLAELTDLLGDWVAGHDVDTDRALQLMDALNDWMVSGGFLPTEWMRDR